MSFVQPGEWVPVLHSGLGSSKTPLGSEDVPDGPRTHCFFCEILPDGRLD